MGEKKKKTWTKITENNVKGDTKGDSVSKKLQ